jgi:methyltransferase (TIGR00027 family)
LWTRAVLSGRGIIDDPQAFEWLPTNTRWLVSPENAKLLPESLIEKLEWIGSRTRFLDQAVDAFLAEHADPQVVVVGAGYDTRCARYGGRAKFFEVDLPSAVEAKKRILAKRSPSITVEHLPLNLEDLKAGPSLPERLTSTTSFDPQKPTLYVFEAVLFYLSPPACSALLDAALTQGARVALTDSLTKLGVAPRGPAPPPNKAACAEFFEGRGGALGAHDVRWGGALHYADVVASSSTA